MSLLNMLKIRLVPGPQGKIWGWTGGQGPSVDPRKNPLDQTSLVISYLMCNVKLNDEFA